MRPEREEAPDGSCLDDAKPGKREHPHEAKDADGNPPRRNAITEPRSLPPPPLAATARGQGERQLGDRGTPVDA